MTEEIELFELSPQQSRFWTRFDGREAGIAQARARLEGSLDPTALLAALRQVVARHDALRSIFRRVDGMVVPFQGVVESDDLDWRTADGRGRPEGERDAAVEEALAADAGRAFDLANGPVLRATLLAWDDESHTLLLSTPCLCADVRSLANLVVELGTVYVGSHDELDEDPMQYLDFADWQHELLTDEAEGGDGRRFWEDRELAEIRQSSLPVLFPEGSRSVGAGREAVEVPVGDLDWQTLSTRLERPVAELALGAWSTFLGSWSGEERLFLAVEMDGRRYAELASGIGLYAKAAPLVLDLDPGRPWSTWLRDLGRNLEEIERHQQYFEWGFDTARTVGEKLEPCLGFVHRQLPEPVRRGGLRVAAEDLRATVEPLALQLVCLESVEGAGLRLVYDPSRFDRQDVLRLARDFADYLPRRLGSPEVGCGYLGLLGETAGQAVVESLNGTRREYPEVLVLDLFAEQVARCPEHPAVVCEDGSLSYRELDSRSSRLARYLHRVGVGGEDLVALCLDRSTHLMVGILGILKAGAAYVPIDPGQPGRRFAMILEDTAPKALLTQESYAEAMSPEGVICLDRDWAQIAAEDDTVPAVEIRPENAAYVIFTSGSTGRPKGVLVEHRQLVNYIRAVSESLDLPAGGTYATVSTFGADLGNTSVYPSLTSGGTLHVLSQAAASDAEAMSEYFRRHEIDCLKIVPSHLEALQEGRRGEVLLPARRLIVGGEASRVDWIRSWAERAGECLLFNHYGPSETTVGVSTYPIAVQDLDPRCATVPIGKPIANARLYLLDRGGRQVPVWGAGELFIGGAGVSRGYLGRPALTAERFVPDPRSLAPGGRMYRTGDLARIVGDGSVEFLGRTDDQVKFHGFRVELNEIRLALSQHPKIRDCVVVATRDGQGREVLAAYYVARGELDFAELRGFLQESILEETIPNAFIHLKRLPLNLNGKVNTQALPSIDEVREKSQRSHVEPSTETEKAMAAIWSEVLGVEKVGAEDNFFELGGHSLLATRILSRQRERFQYEMPLRMLFEMPTVAELSRAVDQARSEGTQDTSEPSLTATALSLEDQLAALDELSDEEAEALLSST